MENETKRRLRRNLKRQHPENALVQICLLSDSLLRPDRNYLYIFEHVGDILKFVSLQGKIKLRKEIWKQQ
jgi:hypothetical protein